MTLLNNKPVQTLLAVGPLIFFSVCFIAYIAFFLSAFSGTGVMYDVRPVINNFNVLFILTSAGAVFFMISAIYFVLHAAQNPLLETGNMRIVWILIIILLNGIGSFIYWLLEIRHRKPVPATGNSLNHEKQNDWSRGLYMKS